ncbi:MAG: GNAT family N-acetyltransferase [Chloroflexi bacterium]|nr:GNAT family N-acetyltransferase [Chloroflexota bacterium]MCL5108997.1 GNAT family N-acetyltransferase [Chloroflexota bacterium]
MAPLVRELPSAETGLAYRVLRELRGQRSYLATLELFVDWVNARERPEGYRLLGAFVEGAADAVGVAGFRRLHTLAWGDMLYLDDLITLPEYRGQGCADALFHWLYDEAKRLGCEQFHLDSGVGPSRDAAHRFYFNHGLAIGCFHFQRQLRGPG